MDSVIFLILRRMRAPLLTLIVLYSIAIVGLVLIPGRNPDGSPWHLSIFHAFYFVSYMSTTIGFGELPREFSDAQRIWVILCVYATVIGWLYSVGSMIALLQDKALRRAMEEHRFSGHVRRVKEDFYLVCGYGQTGSGLVRALTDRGQRAVVLDDNPERIDLLKLESLHEFVPALCADVRRPDSLLLAGLRSPYCAGVLALTSSNEVNLKVALAAKLMHPGAKVICRADSHDIEANMASFGTDHIYDPFDIFARYLSTAIDSPCLTSLQDWLGQLHSSVLPEPIYPPADGLWIICGYGRFGKALHAKLAEQEVEMTVVEMEPERTGLPPGRLIKGRGTEAVTLEQADIHRAVGIVAGTDNDANNLSIIMTAKDLNPSLFTVVRENQLINEELFQAIDADILMHPSLIVAQRIRTLLNAPLLSEFVNHAEKESDSWSCELLSRIVALVDVRPPILWELRVGSICGLAAKSLGEHGDHEPCLGDLLRDPRNRDDRLPAIILVHKRDDSHRALPDLDTPFRAGDELLLCGRPGARDWMQWTLNNPDVLTYVCTGASVPRSSFWRWLAQRRARARGEGAQRGAAAPGIRR